MHLTDTHDITYFSITMLLKGNNPTLGFELSVTNIHIIVTHNMKLGTQAHRFIDDKLHSEVQLSQS